VYIALPALLEEQPQLTCQVLELAIRTYASSTTTEAEQADFALYVLKAVLLSIGASAAAARQCTEQLFSLAVSCIKLAAVRPDTGLPSTAGGYAQHTAASTAAIDPVIFQIGVAAQTITLALQLSDLATTAPHQAAGDMFEAASSSSGNNVSVPLSSSLNSSSSTAAGSSASTDPGRLGLVLAARSVLLEEAVMQSAGGYETLLQVAEMSYAGPRPVEAASDAPPAGCYGRFRQVIQGDIESWVIWSQRVGSLLQQPAVVLPGAAGSGEACAAAKQQLLQLHGRLQQGLDAARQLLDNAYSSSSSSTGSRLLGAGGTGEADREMLQLQPFFKVLPSILQQLKALAEALCTQLPLPYCCNNPGCTELRGASELQLVGGKGCVCARCRWVRADNKALSVLQQGLHRAVCPV
jgi:hypothetical protein